MACHRPEARPTKVPVQILNVFCQPFSLRREAWPRSKQPETRVYSTLTPPSRRGYCFVEYDTREDAERARLKTNGLRVFGKPLVCHFAEEKVLVKNV
jgi:RNA recognition motif-containing protein